MWAFLFRIELANVGAVQRLHDADPREHRRAAERRLRQLRLLCVPKRRVDIAFFHFARITVCPAFFPNPVDLVVIAAQIKGRVDNPEEKNREYREADHLHARLPPKIRRRRLKPSEAQAPPLLNFALDQVCHRTIRKLLDRLRRVGIRRGTVADEFHRAKTFAAIPHGVFALRPIPLIAPGLIVGLGPPRRKGLPCRFEVGARLLEGVGGAGRALARVRSRIEAAAPLPLRRGVGVADAAHDRADVHVAEVRVDRLSMAQWSISGESGVNELALPIWMTLSFRIMLPVVLRGLSRPVGLIAFVPI
jgi:hypothetical protein